MDKTKKIPQNMPADRMPPKMQLDTKALRRVLGYMKAYKGQMVLVVICILLSAIA